MDAKSFLYQSIKKIIHFDVRTTNNLVYACKKDNKYDLQWLKKI